MAVLLGFAGLLLPTSVFAATVIKPPTVVTPAANLPYDGTDPATDGCYQGAGNAENTILNSGGNYGVLTLRYSGNCGTAWTRFTCEQSVGCTDFTIWVTRNNDGKSYNEHITFPAEVVADGSTTWTDQLYDGEGYTSKACYEAYGGFPTICTLSY